MTSPRKQRTVRALKYVVDLAILVAIVWAFTFRLWVGAFAVIAWFFLANAIRVAVLAPFFGEEAVREALWGGLVLEPPAKDQSFPEPPDDLVGRACRTRTELDPEGDVVIEGRRYAARSDGRVVPEGTKVTVVDTRLGHLVVKPTNSDPR